jgi:simple sugar transport system permease protein
MNPSASHDSMPSQLDRLRSLGRRSLLALRATLPAILALVLALCLGGILVALLGRNPWTVFVRLADSIFGNAFGMGQVLFKATTLIGTGLSVAVAFRAGFFNIGAEGQMYLGGLAAGVVALLLPETTPGLIAPVVALSAAALAGALWGAIPGALKAWLGVHEVINTIMMNFIAFALGSWLLVEHLALFETLHTAEIPAAARLARFETFLPAFRGAPVNLMLLLQIVFCAASWLLLWRTRWGFEVRAVGQSAQAARVVGIPVRRRMVQAMALSGAIAGISACNFVLGYKHYFEEGFTAEAGFKGIAVSLLGANHPFGVIPAALMFGGLDRGGFAINALVPKEIVDIMQALVILLVIVLAPRLAGRMRREQSAPDRQGPQGEEG